MIFFIETTFYLLSFLWYKSKNQEIVAHAIKNDHNDGHYVII